MVEVLLQAHQLSFQFCRIFKRFCVLLYLLLKIINFFSVIIESRQMQRGCSFINLRIGSNGLQNWDASCDKLLYKNTVIYSVFPKFLLKYFLY